MSNCLTCDDKGWVPLHPDSPCDCYMPCVSCGGGWIDKSPPTEEDQRRVEEVARANGWLDD